MSLNVCSLFTNIPLEFVINSLVRRYTTINNNCKIPYNEIVDTIKYLYNTYYTFNSVIFKQLIGTLIGSARSSLLADIVMDDLETECINLLDYTPLFFYRYVDDIILSIPENKINYTLDTFNTYYHNLNFTIELEQKNSLSFLDITLIKNSKNIITTNCYQKSTFSGRVLHFNSNHLLNQKICHDIQPCRSKFNFVW